MQTIKLNLIPGSVLPVVNVSQYDKFRQFALQVYEGAASYSLTGKSVQIRGTKPDGNGFAYDSTDGVVSVSGNTVTISTTQQMTAVGGQTMAELRITSGDTILGTINFILDVEYSALSDDTPISDTDIPAIERDFEAALEQAQTAAETATTQAGIATTKAGEAATSATNAGNSAATAGNAATTATTKAGEASTSATNAGNSAAAAAADSLEAEGWAVGEQGGTPVGPTSPYYHNNAKYYSEQTDVTSLASMSDVDLTSPTNNQVLKYDSATQKWVNGTGGGGADALDDLSDVDITSAAEGDLLQYDLTSGKWVNNATIPQKVAGLQKTGCVNVMQNTAISSVDAGISYVVNANKTVSASGLSTDVSAIYTCGTSSQYVKNDISGPFKFVGSPTVNGVRFVLRTSSDGVTTTGTYEDFGSGVIVPDAPYIKAYIRINNGVNLTTPALFKPMLTTDLSATYDDYQPYSMTNRELTEAVVYNKGDIFQSPYAIAGSLSEAYGLTRVMQTTASGQGSTETKFIQLIQLDKPVAAGVTSATCLDSAALVVKFPGAQVSGGYVLVNSYTTDVQIINGIMLIVTYTASTPVENFKNQDMVWMRTNGANRIQFS